MSTIPRITSPRRFVAAAAAGAAIALCPVQFTASEGRFAANAGEVGQAPSQPPQKCPEDEAATTLRLIKSRPPTEAQGPEAGSSAQQGPWRAATPLAVVQWAFPGVEALHPSTGATPHDRSPLPNRRLAQGAKLEVVGESITTPAPAFVLDSVIASDGSPAPTSLVLLPTSQSRQAPVNLVARPAAEPSMAAPEPAAQAPLVQRAPPSPSIPRAPQVAARQIPASQPQPVVESLAVSHSPAPTPFVPPSAAPAAPQIISVATTAEPSTVAIRPTPAKSQPPAVEVQPAELTPSPAPMAPQLASSPAPSPAAPRLEPERRAAPDRHVEPVSLQSPASLAAMSRTDVRPLPRTTPAAPTLVLPTAAEPTLAAASPVAPLVAPAKQARLAVSESASAKQTSAAAAKSEPSAPQAPELRLADAGAPAQPAVPQVPAATAPASLPALPAVAASRPVVETKPVLVAAAQPPRQPDPLPAPPSPTAPPDRQEPVGDPNEWQLGMLEAIRVGVVNSKDVVVLRYAPQIVSTAIAQECSLFDPVFGLNAYGGQDDRQVRSLVESQGANIDVQRTDIVTPLYQPDQVYMRHQLYTGGELKYGFGTDYSNYSPPGDFLLLNPGWNSNFNVRYRQPLGAGRGYTITTNPLRIARSATAQSRMEFSVQVRRVILDIETAFWTLGGAQRELQIARQYRDVAVRTAEDEAEREKLGSSSLPDVLIARGQAEAFNIQVIQAEQRAAVAADQLRQVMGLRTAGAASFTTDGLPPELANKRLAPLVLPQDVEVDLEWGAAVRTALARPEISAQRAAVRTADLVVYQARNGLLPNVSLQADYAATGLEDRLDKSIGTAASHNYNLWGVGLFYERPLGMRSASAFVKRAQLQYGQELAQLRKLEHDILHQLRQSYETVRNANRVWLEQQQRVATFKQQHEAYVELYQQGKVELFRLLDIERSLAAAELEANAAWTVARTAEARWRFEKFEDAGYYNLEFAD
ncbi:MAG: TolC family protein [Pirellulales bacterium]|nr:TolC family protein [Pirellulales bacterium]